MLIDWLIPTALVAAAGPEAGVHDRGIGHGRLVVPTLLPHGLDGIHHDLQELMVQGNPFINSAASAFASASDGERPPSGGL